MNLVSIKPEFLFLRPRPPVVGFQATSSSVQVMSLESALAQSKSEISAYIKQLNQTQDNFQRELAVKQQKLLVAERGGPVKVPGFSFDAVAAGLVALLQSQF